MIIETDKLILLVIAQSNFFNRFFCVDPTMMKKLFFLIKFGAVLSEIVHHPSNTAVIAGDWMNMICVTVNKSKVNKWTFINSSRFYKTIYTKGQFTKNMEHFGVIINANGPVMIYANSTKSSDAGVYTCHCAHDGRDVEYSAHLIVLESFPVCEINLTRNTLVDGDHIWIKCSVNFRGFWAPRMQWIQHGDGFEPEGKTIANGIETLTNRSKSVISTLIIAVNSSLDGSLYVCKIYFSKDDNTEVMTTADNVPDFTYTWSSSVMYVSTKSAITVPLPTVEVSSSVNWYVMSVTVTTALFIVVIVTVALAIAYSIQRKKRVSKSIKNAEEMELHSSPGDYQNVNSDANATIGDSHTSTYMELTTSIQASQPVYSSIDIAGKMLTMPNSPSPVYENLADA